MPKQSCYFQQKAMATLFEGCLIGEDSGHLRAVSQLLQEEIIRLENLLSRYDSTAELARINREARKSPVKTERELFAVLEHCQDLFTQTEGFFDIGIQDTNPQGLSLSERLILYPDSSEVFLAKPGLSLDLGAYGKGYALDKLDRLLEAYGVSDFFLHGGRSSVLVKGRNREGNPWTVALENGVTIEVEKGFSCSATHHKEDSLSDILEPKTGKPLTHAGMCAVWAENATLAEVYSTALLAMGEERVRACTWETLESIRVRFINTLSA